MSKSVQRSSSAVSAQDGRYIFAYCNIRTNQVLYSLKRKLKDKVLGQLPDVGANNNPPTIRKDLWKPLWTLAYDKDSQGYKHGLQAYMELKDYRILHDYNTKLPAVRWPSRERREELQEMLDTRGGSKITTVGKLVARENKKARARAVMDQKANSIADLAAVLLRQEREAAGIEREWGYRRRDEIALMVEQADRPMEFIERLKPILARIAGSMHSKASGPKVDGRLTNRALEAAQLSVIRAIKSIKASSEHVTQARARLGAAIKRNQDAIKIVATMMEEQKASMTTESDQDASKTVANMTEEQEDAIKIVASMTEEEKARMTTESDQDAIKTVAMIEEQKASMATTKSNRRPLRPLYRRLERRMQETYRQRRIGEKLQPSDEIQGTLDPATAVTLRLIAHFPKPDPAAETISTDSSAMQWQKVEGSIMSAKTLDELQSALRVIERRGRGAEICEAVTALQSSGVMASANESTTREIAALELARYIPSPSQASIPIKDLPKDADERERLRRTYLQPNFTKRARVQWQDVRNKDFAARWPKSIRHTPMGIIGNEAPDPFAPVLMDATDYSKRAAYQSEYNRLLESEALEAEGKHEQARELRESITMVRKNEHGEYIRAEERVLQSTA